MINYLVLGQMDAYITSHWFKELKYAEKCADRFRGKERIIQEIEGVLTNVDFDDEEYRVEELYDLLLAADGYEGREDYEVGVNEDADGYDIYSLPGYDLVAKDLRTPQEVITWLKEHA